MPADEPDDRDANPDKRKPEGRIDETRPKKDREVPRAPRGDFGEGVDTEDVARQVDRLENDRPAPRNLARREV